MTSSPNAPERDPKAHDDAGDSGDEDVFHDAHFPAEEEAVSPTGFPRTCATRLILIFTATREGISGNQV